MKAFRLLLSLSLLFILSKSKAQSQTPDEAISERTADSIAKYAFAKMVAGSDEVANLSNYVSFVPTEGKFTLSGNSFFSIKNKGENRTRKANFFAIGFNATGDISSGNIATLFESAKLNTGVDMGIKFSWRIDKPNIGSLRSESVAMIEKRNNLQTERDNKIDSARHSLTLLDLQIRLKGFQIKDSFDSLAAGILDTTRLSNLLKSCADDTCRRTNTTALVTAKNKVFTEMQQLEKLKKDSIKLNEIYDVHQIRANTPWENLTPREQELSKKYGLVRINLSYEDTVLNKIKKDYEGKIYEVELARPIAGMRLNWLSALFNWNRVAYRTYYDSLPFAEALTKVKLPGYTIGLQANFYTFYRPVRKAKLTTIALLYKKTSNLEDFSTSKLSQEKLITEGSASRKASVDYNVYTDIIQSYKTLQLAFNHYRFFDKDLRFGWHSFALADWRDTNESIYDIGTGFIFGLNSSETKRILNLEVFLKYKDVTRELSEEGESGWKNLQFGLSAAVPFIFNKK